jgi:hypothetical protein
MIPRRKKRTIASDAGLTGPIAVVSGRKPPMRAIVTTTMTSIDSSTGLVSETRDVSGCFFLDVASRNTTRGSASRSRRAGSPTARERWSEGRRRRDRQLGERPGEPQQQHSSHRVAEVEASVKDVGGLREIDAGKARRSR